MNYNYSSDGYSGDSDLEKCSEESYNKNSDSESFSNESFVIEVRSDRNSSNTQKFYTLKKNKDLADYLKNRNNKRSITKEELNLIDFDLDFLMDECKKLSFPGKNKHHRIEEIFENEIEEKITDKNYNDELKYFLLQRALQNSGLVKKLNNNHSKKRHHSKKRKKKHHSKKRKKNKHLKKEHRLSTEELTFEAVKELLEQEKKQNDKLQSLEMNLREMGIKAAETALRESESALEKKGNEAKSYKYILAGTVFTAGIGMIGTYLGTAQSTPPTTCPCPCPTNSTTQ